MKKYYPYSVREALEKYFGDDTVYEMRLRIIDYKEYEKESLPVLSWVYADEAVTTHLFSGGLFLKDTLITDDYMVYIIRKKSDEYAYISFMCYENDVNGGIDAEYAYELCREWENKGYKAVIMRVSVAIKYYDDGAFCCNDKGISLFIPAYAGGRYILTSDAPFWKNAAAQFYSAVLSGLMHEYEYLFSSDVTFERSGLRSEYETANNEYSNTHVVFQGIEKLKAYFEKKPFPDMVYLKKAGQTYYDMHLLYDGRYYVMYVNRLNKICRIIEKKTASGDDIIPVPQENISSSLIPPTAVSVRALDITAIHGYGIRLSYSDGCEKNYYLAGFDTVEIPDSINIDGYVFNEDVLTSVRLISDFTASEHREGVIFRNGCYIPFEKLYALGISQLVPEKMDCVPYSNGKIRLKGAYRHPLSCHSLFSGRTYAPRQDEYYGANETLMRNDGSRINDYSARYINYNYDPDEVQFFLTISEANDKIGYIGSDGEWLFPPVFDRGDSFGMNYCTSAFIGEQQYLLNIYGDMIPFSYEIETQWFFRDGLCPCSAGEYTGGEVKNKAEYTDELKPGIWGYTDIYGNIRIKPQYVFALPLFWANDRAFVARANEGYALWGMIDTSGREIVPCEYLSLDSWDDEVIIFRTKDEKCGLMDYNGNIIYSSQYRYIAQYDLSRKLIAVCDKSGMDGVISLSDERIIIPFLYDCIFFEDDYIVCETMYGEEVYYDYEGNQIIPVTEEGKREYCKDGFCIRGKEGRQGVFSEDGTEILPCKYRRISISDGFIIASHGSEGNSRLRDELYLTDGTLVFNDIYRNVNIKDGILTRNTPLGKEYYYVEKTE